MSNEIQYYEELGRLVSSWQKAKDEARMLKSKIAEAAKVIRQAAQFLEREAGLAYHADVPASFPEFLDAAQIRTPYHRARRGNFQAEGDR